MLNQRDEVATIQEEAIAVYSFEFHDERNNAYGSHLPVWLTDLTLSCAAVPRAEAEAARRLPRMTFGEPSRDLQPPSRRHA